MPNRVLAIGDYVAVVQKCNSGAWINIMDDTIGKGAYIRNISQGGYFSLIGLEGSMGNGFYFHRDSIEYLFTASTHR